MPDFLFYSLILLFLLSIGIPGMMFAPWVPTRRRDFGRVARLLDVQPGMTVMDLGCGTGSVLLEMAKRHPQASFVGVELAAPLYLICVLRNFFSRSKNISFRLANLLTTDISKADRIFVFGMPESLGEKLKEKLFAQAKPGVFVVSYCFNFKNWEPETTLERDGVHLPVFRYRVRPPS